MRAEGTAVPSGPDQFLPAARPHTSRDLRPHTAPARDPLPETTFSDVVRVALREWKRICAAAAVALVLGVVYCVFARRLYSSAVTVRIGSYAPVIQGAEGEMNLRQESMEQDFRQTQIASAVGLKVADEVLADGRLRGRLTTYLEESRGPVTRLKDAVLDLIPSGEKPPAEEEPHYRRPVPLLNAYLRLVDVLPVRETSLVRVTVTTGDPGLSARLANAHAEAFIRVQREERQSAVIGNLAFLQGQADDLKRKVASAERKVAEYSERNELYTLSKDENVVVKQLAEFNTLKAGATADRIKTEALLAEVRAAGPTDSTALDDDSIRNLRVALKEAEAEYADVRQKFTTAYPRATQLKAKIDSLASTINQQRRQALRGLEAVYRGHRGAEEKLSEQILQQKAVANDTSKRLVEYNVLEREYESLKDLLQTVLRQLKESQISAASQGSNVVVAEPAVVPSAPSSPRRVAVMTFSLLGGLLAGLGLAVAREMSDATVKTPSDAATSSGLPVLGFVPSLGPPDGPRDAPPVRRSFRERIGGAVSWFLGRTPPRRAPHEEGDGYVGGGARHHGAGRPGPLVTISAPRAAASEAFRTVRTGILLASERPPKTLMITSGGKGEGKTTVASNLAVTLAQAGLRTILVDADIRQPQVRSRFGLGRERNGLSDYLAGTAALQEVIVPTAVRDLYVITAGFQATNPAELVGSKRMAELLRHLGAMFDHVILDTPPVVPVADSLMLSRYVEGVVLVTRSGMTASATAREAVRRLDGVRAPLIGVVVNDLDLRATGTGYGKGVDDYYVVRRRGDDMADVVGA